MEEMYALTIGIHSAVVWGLIAVVVVNMALLETADELHGYAKRMRIWMPVSSMLLAAVLFTGVVMMAAKHLSFSVENILMIIIAVGVIVFEAKRYATLKHFNIHQEHALDLYKAKARRLLGIEFAAMGAIGLWMVL